MINERFVKYHRELVQELAYRILFKVSKAHLRMVQRSIDTGLTMYSE